MKKINKKNKGFTLIELIVVVTIIAVLTVVGVVSYSGTNKKARDNRRMIDLNNIKIALELYRQGTGSTYPASIDSLVPLYLGSTLVGPKNDAYIYVKDVSGYKYTLTAISEGTGTSYVVTQP